MEAPCEVRIDKWLWAVRLFKTRSLAAQACRAGHVAVGGQRVKPSRNIRVAEVITARAGGLLRTVKVLELVENRVGPKLVSRCMEDQTPAAEFLRQAEAAAQARASARDAGGREGWDRRERRARRAAKSGGL